MQQEDRLCHDSRLSKIIGQEVAQSFYETLGQVFSVYVCVYTHTHTYTIWASQVALVVKNPPANAGDAGSIPESERSPGKGHSNPPQYSCL